MTDTIRVAFLGTGGIAGKHSQELKTMPGIELVGACDVSTEAVQKFIDHTLTGVATPPAIFIDPAEMYAQCKPDAVVICTPHTMHFNHCMQALDAGCHVLVEKPMVTQADHAYALRDKVEQTGKILIVGYNTSCSGEFLYLRNAIRDQTLGKLELVNGFLSQGWLSAVQGLWRLNPKLSGGGQAYDSGAHLLNSLCWSVGANISEVFAMTDNLGTEVDINSAIMIRFDNGVLANITISGNCPSNGADLHYLFTEGRVDIDGWAATWMNVYEGNNSEPIDVPITPEMDAGSPVNNFVDAIRGKSEPRTPPVYGIIQSELMDAIYESARTGQPAKPKRRD